MKNMIIKNFYPPYTIGGAEVNVENIANQLAKEGIKMVVICMGKSLIPEVEVKNENL